MQSSNNNAIVGQSGGPTSAINATLAGVIRGALDAKKQGIIDTLYGMKNGIEGFLREDLVDLFDIFSDEKDIDLLAKTPSSALGSCRKRLNDLATDRETYERILEILKKYRIKYFYYIGGNDSMDTVHKLSEYAKSVDYELYVVGIPKTVDNDLTATDHTPGFGSASKYVATIVKGLIRDISVYTMKAVAIVEIMGRDAGWLTASSALPTLTGEKFPQLIYLPERAFDVDKFVLSLERCLSQNPAVLVCVSEGIKFENGEYVGASGSMDAFGHKQLSGAGGVLKAIVRERIGCKVRSIELSLPQRCASHILSLTDIEESLSIGHAGVIASIEGKSGVMMSFVRHKGEEYSVSIGCENIVNIANAVRGVPDEYINEEGNGVTDACLSYLAPLILGEVPIEYEHGMPKHFIIN